MKNKIYPMFVYGTLLNKNQREYLGVFAEETKEATLKNFRKDGLNVIPSAGDNVGGLYFYVTEPELAALDRYEGLPNFYHRMEVSVDVDGKNKRAYVYQLN